MVRRGIEARIEERTGENVRDYLVNDLLYHIAIEQYQQPFNQNPEKTLSELRVFAAQKNGVNGLAEKVLGYYTQVYTFEIPGYGSLQEAA